MVNGHPAPLAFRVPREPARTDGDRCHSLAEATTNESRHGDGGAADDESIGVFRLDSGGLADDDVVSVRLKTGGRDIGNKGGGGGGDDADDSRRQEQCNEAGVHEDAREESGQTQEELQERAVAAAAREWCHAFGTDRAQDIAFVEAEIRKTVAAAQAAAAAAAAAATAAADGEQSTLEGPDAGRVPPTGDESDGRETRQERATGGDGGKKERRRAERPAITSVLAPEAKKGTTVFWVKVKRSETDQRMFPTMWGAPPTSLPHSTIK